jgi:hypothetical protein
MEGDTSSLAWHCAPSLFSWQHYDQQWNVQQGAHSSTGDSSQCTEVPCNVVDNTRFNTSVAKPCATSHGAHSELKQLSYGHSQADGHHTVKSCIARYSRLLCLLLGFVRSISTCGKWTRRVESYPHNTLAPSVCLLVHKCIHYVMWFSTHYFVDHRCTNPMCQRCINPRWQHFVQWQLMFVGPQYGTCFMSPIRHLEFLCWLPDFWNIYAAQS